MFNQFIFADITELKRDSDRHRFFTHESNLITVEILPPLVQKIHSLFRIEIRMSEIASSLQASRSGAIWSGNSEETACKISHGWYGRR